MAFDYGWDERDCPDGLSTCPNCLDHCLEYVDREDETDTTYHCPACGFVGVWTEPDDLPDIILPKYED